MQHSRISSDTMVPKENEKAMFFTMLGSATWHMQRDTATLAFFIQNEMQRFFTYRSFKVTQCCEDNANVEMDLCGVCDGLYRYAMCAETKSKKEKENIITSGS